MRTPDDFVHYLTKQCANLQHMFKINVMRFVALEENETFEAPNMQITCLRKEESEITGEKRFIFWWEHFQKDEDYIIKLIKSENKWFLNVVHAQFSIKEKSYNEQLKSGFLETCNEFYKRYTIKEWFSQLITELNARGRRKRI